MLANPADCVVETVITMGAVAHRPPYQLHDQRVSKRYRGASVRGAALSRTIDSPAYEIVQCLDSETITWISGAFRDLR